jgi:oxygen-dependent protoporphyrinogen oxidase
MSRVIVVGGGVSGLAAAYYLARDGHACTLVEPQPGLGGVIRTEIAGDCVIEAGPDSFLSQKPWALQLIRELGLAGEVIDSNDHLRKTYMVRRGRLVPMPDGLYLMVPTAVAPVAASRLLSLRTKARMCFELLRRPPAYQFPDRSVASFVRDHYGDEAVQYLAEPLLAGIYGGDPEQLSVLSVLPRFVEFEQRYGSVTRGVLASRPKSSGPQPPLFQSLRRGMQQLVDTLAEAIAGSVTIARTAVRRLERLDTGFRAHGPGLSLESQAVVLAVPAYIAGELLRPVDAALGDLLAAVPYHSSITVALGYDRAGFHHPLNGFGFLVPKVERRLLTACTWVGTKFPHRVGDNRVLLRAFIGAGGRDDLLDRSEDELVTAVREELRARMGVTETPLVARLHRWRRAMAQYTVGHSRRQEEISARLARLPALHLAGNAYLGIGVPDCIRTAQLAAARLSGRAGEA